MTDPASVEAQLENMARLMHAEPLFYAAYLALKAENIELAGKLTQQAQQAAQRESELLALLAATREERDLAIAHDRQPYPTSTAYEEVCRARQHWQDRAEAAESALRLARQERDDLNDKAHG